MSFVLEQFANLPQTKLTSGITSGQTTISVASAAGFSTGPQFRIVIDTEILLVTGVAGTTWTVTRGAEATAAASHNNNAPVTQILTAGGLANNPGAMTAANDLETLNAVGQRVRVSGAASAISLSVMGYGAVADGITDNTTAFQNALNAAATLGGATVYVPPGNYLFTGKLLIPPQCTLQGSYGGALSHAGFRILGGGNSILPTAGGTCLQPTGFSGTTTVANSFIMLKSNSTLTGVCIYYPNQPNDTASDATPPISYPPAIALRGTNCNVNNVEMLNPYIGIDINRIDSTGPGEVARPTIRDVTGQPLFRGIVMGTANDDGSTSDTKIDDIVRFTNIHFNPWFAWSTPTNNHLFNWQQNNGRGFLIYDVDECECVNCFAYGYIVGLELGANQTGSWGSWTGGAFDTCQICVQITGQGQEFGWTFLGTVMIITGISYSHILKPAGGTDLMFHGCRFHQNFSSRPILVTTGGDNEYVTSFIGCNFRAYGNPCFQVGGGKVIIQGNIFAFSPSNTTVAQTDGFVLATGNFVQGGFTSTGTVTAANNVSFT